jgi:hypothetical protein
MNQWATLLEEFLLFDSASVIQGAVYGLGLKALGAREV